MPVTLPKAAWSPVTAQGRAPFVELRIQNRIIYSGIRNADNVVLDTKER